MTRAPTEEQYVLLRAVVACLVSGAPVQREEVSAAVGSRVLPVKEWQDGGDELVALGLATWVPRWAASARTALHPTPRGVLAVLP